MKDYIIGRSRSDLDLKAAQAKTLELDMLRMALSIQHHIKQGNNCKGVLLVMNSKANRRVNTWLDKYNLKPNIEVYEYQPTPSELIQLKSEKKGNKVAIANPQGNASANYAQSLGAKRLKEHIEKKYSSIKQTSNNLFNLEWTYFGVY
jgi:arsenate reductase-like glutaredoxin family protein